MGRICLLSLLLISNNYYSQYYSIDKKKNYSLDDSLIFYPNRIKLSKDPCFTLSESSTKAYLLYNENKYEESETVLDRTLAINDSIWRSGKIKPQNHSSFNEECYNKVKLNAFRRLFYIKYNQNKFDEGIGFLNKCDILIESLPHDENYYLFRLELQKNYASIKSATGDEPGSIKILKNIKFSRIDTNSEFYLGYTLMKMTILNSVAIAYTRFDPIKTYHLDSAELYFTKAYRVSNDILDPLKKHMYYHMKDLTTVYILQKKYKEAMLNIDKCEDISKKYDYFRKENYNKFLCFFGMNQTDSVLQYGNILLRDKQSTSKKENYLAIIYNRLSTVYYDIKILDSAYKYSRLALQLAKKNSRKELNANIKLNHTELNKIHVLKDKIEKDKNSLTNEYQLKVILFTFFILTIIYVFFLYSKRQKKRTVELIGELKKSIKPVTKKKSNSIPLNKKITDKIIAGLINMEESKLYLDKDFNLNTLAKTLNTNTSYLSKVINERENKSFKKYIIELRINHLIEILDSDPILRKHTMKSLGETIGYPDGSSFNRAFKAHKGCSPLKFIKNNYPESQNVF